MTQITITAQGPQGCGKTTALINILAELEAAGLLKRDDTTFSEDTLVYSGDHREFATFTAIQTEPSFLRKIFGEISRERAYQTEKWGNSTDDTLNTPWMWVSYITQYATKWMTGLFTFPSKSVDLFREAMIKTATTCVAAVESLDRQRLKNGRAFYETADA